MDGIRIDKFLWAVRVFKTRTDAADACSGNKVRLNGSVAKPSKTVKTGDVIEVHKASASFTYKVLQPASGRMGAATVPDYVEDLTPDSEREKLRAPVETIVLRRDRGSGRPTKKERRELDELLGKL